MSRGTKVILTVAFLMAIVIASYIFIKPKAKNRYNEWAYGLMPETSPDEYDVIVVGSDPEGICAAIASARSGAKTLLLGKEDGPGGLFTYGMLNSIDMNRNQNGEIITRGIFSEFYSKIGNVDSFDVAQVKTVLEEMISKESKLTYLRNRKFDSAIMDKNKIIGVKMIDSYNETAEFKGKIIIDATQDGDVAVSAGAPYYVGMNDVNWGEAMAVTLVFKVENVDWQQLAVDIETYKKETGDLNCGINERSAWAFGKWCYDNYPPVHKNMKLRGPNIGLQSDGSILINALQIFDVDGLNEESINKALKEGAEESERIVEYFRALLPSFKEARFAGTADALYIRETRHIQGEYVLKATDLLANTNFEDKIALGSYPIDIQSTNIKNTGYVIGAPTQYSVPLRSIIPLNVENMFIVGKAASYSSVAAGSARVVPVGMVVGESAGVSAVYSIVKGITPRELSKNSERVNEVISIIRKQGGYLPEFELSDPNEKVVGYSQIKKLINLGFLSGGYKNDFAFEKEATIGNFAMAIVNGLQRGGHEKYTLDAIASIKSYSVNKISAVEAARIMAIFFGEELDEMPRSFTTEEDLAKAEIDAYGKMDDKEKAIYESLEKPTKRIFAEMTKIERKEYTAKSEDERKEIELQKTNEKNRSEILKDSIWSVAKARGYFNNMAEEITRDQILNRRQVYELAVNVLERYLGRSL